MSVHDRMNHLLGEASSGSATFPPDLLKKVKQLTSENDHNEARRVVAHWLRSKTLASAFAGMDAIMAHFGHRPSSMRELTQQLDDDLKALLQRTLTPDEFAAVWKSL